MVPGSSPGASLLLTQSWRYPPAFLQAGPPLFGQPEARGLLSFPQSLPSLSEPVGLAAVSPGEVPLCAWAGLKRAFSSRCGRQGAPRLLPFMAC